MITKNLIIFVLIFAIFSMTINASADDKTFNWYCKRTKDHSQPPLPSEFEFIEKYHAYYVGKNKQEKVIYLTFDAGYENGNVERILDILKNNNVSAAFFVLSNLIKNSTDIVLRMRNEGHMICNHTSNHKDVTQIPDFNHFKNEVFELEKVYDKYIGGEIDKYFRPPEGKFNEQALKYVKELGYKTVFWSFAYADWDNNNQMSENEATKKIMDNVHNGAVILLHPTSETNVKILDKIIKQLKNDGYRFGTLDELIAGNE